MALCNRYVTAGFGHPNYLTHDEDGMQIHGSAQLSAAEEWISSVRSTRAEAVDALRTVWAAEIADQDTEALAHVLDRARSVGVGP